MQIKTLKNGIVVQRDNGKMSVEVQVGVCCGYSDVLHFYFPNDCHIRQEKGHVTVLRPKVENPVSADSTVADDGRRQKIIPLLQKLFCEGFESPTQDQTLLYEALCNLIQECV